MFGSGLPIRLTVPLTCVEMVEGGAWTEVLIAEVAKRELVPVSDGDGATIPTHDGDFACGS